MAIRRKIPGQDGAAALAQVQVALATGTTEEQKAQAFAALPRSVRATAVRYALEELATLAPGNSVEVRVPPYGVAQCIAGPKHTRGTPPNVVETDSYTWCCLVLGVVRWEQTLPAISASGLRSNLSGYFPLF